jgi:hypothetical protein
MSVSIINSINFSYNINKITLQKAWAKRLGGWLGLRAESPESPESPETPNRPQVSDLTNATKKRSPEAASSQLAMQYGVTVP